MTIQSKTIVASLLLCVVYTIGLVGYEIGHKEAMSEVRVEAVQFTCHRISEILLGALDKDWGTVHDAIEILSVYGEFTEGDRLALLVAFGPQSADLIEADGI